MFGNFDRCYAVTRKYEGGKVNHPKDPGGKTNYGVTQRTYTAWLKSRGKPNNDVYAITADEVKSIYHDEYWAAAKCDSLPVGVDMVVFDTAINSGPARSGILLQASLNAKLPAPMAKLSVDGDIGSKTLEALRMFSTPEALKTIIVEFCNRRLAFVKSLEGWKTFGKGWAARIGNSQTVALSMISLKHVVPNTRVTLLEETSAKAYETDIATTAVSVETATKASGVTAVSSGVLEAVKGAAGTFQGLADVADTFRYIFIALTVGLAVYAIYTAFVSSRNAKVLDGKATVPKDEAEALMEDGVRDVIPV